MTRHPLTSYAQHAEDITLLQGFKDQATGFYVDIGAASPVQHSVTKLFYDIGWHGINVEPIKEQYRMLSQQRPRDINIQAAIDTIEGSEEFYIFPTLPGLSTTDTKVAERHIASGLPVRKDNVKKLRLETILTQHARNSIDFLKIDVEGAEVKVLKSFDLNKWQPKVLIVEATEPRTDIPAHNTWEPIVLSAGYKMVQFDGLNRFYALAADSNLCEKLSHKAKGYVTYSISQQHSKLGL